MSEARLERAWKPTSRDAAIVAFGVLALPVHFVKTLGHTRSVLGVLGYLGGLLVGILAVLLVAVVGGFLLEGVFRVAGLPLPE